MNLAGRGGAASDLLTPAIAADLAIQFDGLEGAAAGAAVPDSDAIRVAQLYLGTVQIPASVRHGQAPQHLNSPVRSVWIVTFDGIAMPMVGPSMEPGGSVVVTGVIVDDETGDVLRAFSVSEPAP